MRSGADVNAREGKAGYTALHMAVERGDRDLVKFLLDECSSSVNLEVASYGRWTAYQIATVNRNQVCCASRHLNVAFINRILSVLLHCRN